MKNSTINKIKTLLGMEVKLEQMKLADGQTILEADSFEMDSEVFIVTDDGQKIPLPIGEYEMEDGMILSVVIEGVIAEIKEAVVEEPAVEDEVAVEETVEATEAAPTAVKKTIESTVKETFFSEIEALKNENIELKAQLEKLSAVDVVTEEVTELAEVKPISFNPENTNEVETFRFAKNRQRNTLDSILEKFNK